MNKSANVANLKPNADLGSGKKSKEGKDGKEKDGKGGEKDGKGGEKEKEEAFIVKVQYTGYEGGFESMLIYDRKREMVWNLMKGDPTSSSSPRSKKQTNTNFDLDKLSLSSNNNVNGNANEDGGENGEEKEEDPLSAIGRIVKSRGYLGGKLFMWARRKSGEPDVLSVCCDVGSLPSQDVSW